MEKLKMEKISENHAKRARQNASKRAFFGKNLA